jgi:Xaa-Pro aminopeptidase
MLLNLTRARRVMADHGLAALVATSPDNVTYTSGYWSASHWSRPGPQVYAVLPGDPSLTPCVVAHTSNLDHLADGEAWVSEAYRYGFFATVTGGDRLSDVERRYAALLAGPDHGDAVGALAAALRDRKLDRERVGIDETSILPANLERLRRELPGLTVTPAARFFRDIRAVKTPEEIERLRGAVRVTEAGIEAALAIARPGVTERALARELERAVIAGGGTPVMAMCVGFGAHSALSNVQPGDRALAPGETIRFDGGVRFRLYRSDIARIAALGDPGEKVRRYYAGCRAGVEAGIRAIRPGVKTADVFTTVVDAVRSYIPHFQRNHTGHGIGINNYDAPDLAPSSTEVIEEGMVLCVETPYYELGFAGLQLENTVVVGPRGAEPLVTLGNELRIL